MKYIIVNYGGLPTPFPFPEHVPHDRVKVVQDDGTFAPVESAGFCDFDASFVSCHGASQSLKLASRGRKDEKSIEMYIRRRTVV